MFDCIDDIYFFIYSFNLLSYLSGAYYFHLYDSLAIYNLNCDLFSIIRFILYVCKCTDITTKRGINSQPIN